MNPELKEKWITALKSGKYQQGQHVLRNKNNEFCCLGVLCDIINPNGWAESDNRQIFIFGEDTCATNLSRSILKAVDFNTKQEGVLMNMNDSGECFYKIADYIEREL